jgi:hypothetical protein
MLTATLVGAADRKITPPRAALILSQHGRQAQRQTGFFWPD